MLALGAYFDYFYLVPKPKGPEKWQLYNLAKDPGEIHDLAEQEPERMERMVKLWDQYGKFVLPIVVFLHSVAGRAEETSNL